MPPALVSILQLFVSAKVGFSLYKLPTRSHLFEVALVYGSC